VLFRSRDANDFGARIKLTSQLFVPNTFSLRNTSDKTARDCQVVWRNDIEIGVKFVDVELAQA